MQIINNGLVQNQINIGNTNKPSMEEVAFAKKIRSLYAKDPNDVKINLRAELRGRQFKESQRALEYAIEAHRGAKRDSDDPYIIHPFAMACEALAHSETTDDLVATLLLHDVVEDCGKSLTDLPVNEAIRYAVELLTKEKCNDQAMKAELTRSYFRNLHKSVLALTAKGIDRKTNLNDMEGFLSFERKKKNIIETHEMLIPELQLAKRDPRFEVFTNLLFIIRQDLKRIVMNFAIAYKIDLKPIRTPAAL